MDLRLETDAELLQALEAHGEFGPLQVQRLMYWGYNRSTRKIEELLERKLIKQAGAEWRFVVTDKATSGQIGDECPE